MVLQLDKKELRSKHATRHIFRSALSSIWIPTPKNEAA